MDGKCNHTVLYKSSSHALIVDIPLCVLDNIRANSFIANLQVIILFFIPLMKEEFCMIFSKEPWIIAGMFKK